VRLRRDGATVQVTVEKSSVWEAVRKVVSCKTAAVKRRLYV
jgi:hypothetical protein